MTIPKLKAPIVLVHGLFGYDELKAFGRTVARYFPDIPEMLREAGNRVLVPRLSPTGGVAERAGQLKDFLDREVPGEAVHCIAHSMGGLDCRYLISSLGLAPRVLTLTTIGTPHRGTAFADLGVRCLEPLLKPVLEWLTVPHQAFYDLTVERCREFNQQVPDAPGVRYFSVAGRFESNWRDPFWIVPNSIVAKVEGPNDGVVSVASATYGESCDIWEGDHLSLVNLCNPFTQAHGPRPDRLPQYAQIVRRLADEGF